MDVEIIDRNYGSDFDQLLSDAEKNLKDDSFYLTVVDIFGQYAVGLTYQSAEGVYGAGAGPLSQEEAQAIVEKIDEATSDTGFGPSFAVYEGGVARVGDTVVRVHGTGMGQLSDATSGYVDKLGRDGAAGEFGYMVQDTFLFGDMFVGSIRSGDNVYFVSGFTDEEATTAFLGDLETAGYTVREGINQDDLELLEKLNPEQGK